MMKRLYRITCGVISHTIEEIASLLTNSFDIDFLKSLTHPDCVEGFFFGTSIRIQKNYNEFTKAWAEIDETEFPIILYAENGVSKEKDKRSIHQYLKHQFSQRDYITFLKEEIIEQAD